MIQHPRPYYDERDRKLYADHLRGMSDAELALRYMLGVETVREIIRKRERMTPDAKIVLYEVKE